MKVGSALFARDPNLLLYLGNTKLERVNCYSYLGVHLDAALNMKLHVGSLYNKVVSKFGTLVNTHHLFDTDTTFMLHCSLLIPIINYCDTIYKRYTWVLLE